MIDGFVDPVTFDWLVAIIAFNEIKNHKNYKCFKLASNRYKKHYAPQILKARTSAMLKLTDCFVKL